MASNGSGVSDSDAHSQEGEDHTSGGGPGPDPGASAVQEVNGSIGTVALATVEERLETIRKEVIKDSDREVDAYREIETLWRIRQSPLHKLALEEWQRKEHEVNSRMTQRALRSQELHTQLHNIIGWYAVFQGVVLTAVSQLTEPAQGPRKLCGKTWFPVVLTGLCTVLTFFAIWRLFRDLLDLEKTINSEKKAKQEAVNRYTKLIRKGVKKFSFEKDANNNQRFPDPEFKLEWKCVLVSLLVFSGVFILSHLVILCDTWMVTKLN